MKATTAETILQGIAKTIEKIGSGDAPAMFFFTLASDAPTCEAVGHVVGAAGSHGAASPEVAAAIETTIARLRVLRGHGGPELVTED